MNPRTRPAATPSIPTRSIIVTSNFPPVVGGACQVYAALAEQGRGQVHVLASTLSFQTGQPIAGTAEFDRSVAYPIHRIPLLRSSAPVGRRLAPAHDLWVMVRLIGVLSWLCLRHRIAVVCIGDLIYAGWLAWPLRYLLGRRVMFYIHGEEMTESAGGLFERWKGTFLRTGHTAIAVSSFARDIAIARLGAAPDRVVTVMNGVDLATFHRRDRADDLAARFGIGPGRVLLTVARLIERKGVDTVLHALPAIAAAIPDLHYLVAGDGPDRPRLQALATELGVAHLVTFTGRLDAADLPRIYTLGDVFIMPNRRLASGDNEGFGLVFLEASATGLPVIGGRAGGTSDAILDGRTGLLVDGTDHRAIASAAIALLSDEPRRRVMAAHGLAFSAECGWPDRFLHYQAAVEATADRHAPPEIAPRFAQPAPAGSNAAQPAVPTLLVVIDAEEQFDWQTYLSDATDVSNMRHLGATTAIFARHGIQPTYMVDYPVATQPDGIEPLRALLATGACTIGAQLHPWVTPPLTRQVSTPRQSYPGQLPAAEERAKLTELTRAIEDRLGARPLAYRAGRYGLGPNTPSILRDLGYRIDCSVLPANDLSVQDGPDFSAWTARPVWLDANDDLFEVPVTVGLLGRLASASWAVTVLGSHRLSRLHLPGILARLGLLERIKLTPEGTSVQDAKRLTRALLARGQHVFVVTYHTSSLVPGLAPYVRTPEDLDRFLAWIEDYCTWFLGEVGGRPGTLETVYRHAVETTRPA